MKQSYYLGGHGPKSTCWAIQGGFCVDAVEKKQNPRRKNIVARGSMIIDSLVTNEDNVVEEAEMKMQKVFISRMMVDLQLHLTA